MTHTSEGEGAGGHTNEADGGLTNEADGDDANRVRGGDADRAGGRDSNLLGACSLEVAGRMDAAVRAAAEHGGAAPAALVALSTFLDGSSIDVMRRPLGLSHSAAVRLADRLAGAGLVSREPGADGRSVSIRLTGEGEVAAERIRSARALALKTVLDPLSTAERKTLAGLHEKLLAGLTSSRADAGHICRLCDADACGHHEGLCPVTRAANRAEQAAA